MKLTCIYAVTEKYCMATVYKNSSDRNARWYANYTDGDGKRCRKCTGTSDRMAALSIAAAWEKDEALVRSGFVDATTAKAATSGKQSVNEHIKRYIDSSRSAGQSHVHLKIKESQLNKLVDFLSAKRLNDITTDGVERFLDSLKSAGKSHRTRNQHRMTALSFFNFLIERGHAKQNPVENIKTLSEDKDRRRIRRALTDNEISLLFQAKLKRRTYYMFAFYTGLRVRACKSAVWGNVDFESATIHVPATDAKSGHDLILPLHPALLGELKSIKPANERPTDRIFPIVPNVLTFHRDCEKAGIPRYDSAGRQIDRHALRTSFGTALARSGVLPQHAARLLGHADIKTTMKHYTALTLSDNAAALARISIPAAAPTGTPAMPPATFTKSA
jgi:integrase